MNKIFAYYSFVIVSIMSITGFLSARSISELLSAVFFFPLVVYFALIVLPRGRKALIIPANDSRRHLEGVQKQPSKLKKIDDGKEKREIDVDRRMLLKLIGSAGLSIFFFSLFTKKTHAAFFGSVPGPGTVALKDTAGVQIDPSQHHPTDGYKISEVDDSSPAFYGFVRKDGAWFIMKEDSSGAYRYTKGASGFSTNWTNRANLTYDYFDAIF